MLTRVHSALVHVPDFETARRDYARLVGFEPSWLERGDEGARSAFFVFPNIALELREITEGGAEIPRPGQGGLRLAWEDGDPAPILADRGLAVGSGQSLRASALEGGAERVWTRHALDPSASRGLPIELVVDESPGALLEPAERVAVDGVADRSTQFHALDHVVVMSPAPDETRAFYGDALGIRLALDKTFDQRGVRLIFFRLAGLTIEIGARASADPAPDQPDRFGGLAWQVPDIDAVQARLAADGFDVSEVRTGHKPGTSVCTVRDPVHGVPTLLIQPVQAI